MINVPTIVQYTLNETIDISNATIKNKQGVAADGTQVTHTTFNTLGLPGYDLTLNQDLGAVVTSYYDDVQDSTSETVIVLNEIKDYAAKIQCSDFKGKGTIDDYAILFQAASKIANDTKQMQLVVEMEGFNEFGKAADDLSKLFNSFIVKLQTVSIIDDLNFLKGIAAALQKIWNLSEVFGRFKQTILATSTVDIPKSAHDTTLLVQSVMSEINCAMGYINHFVDSTIPSDADADLSADEKNVISKAVATIDNWNLLSQQGVSIAMNNSPDISFISTASSSLKNKASLLQNNTSTLRSKLAAYNINY
jgi:hypothetical protein